MKFAFLHFPLIGLALLAPPSTIGAPAEIKNGFVLSNPVIPVEDIRGGGPVKDGIPSIDEPQFERVDEVNFLRDDDMVVSVSIEGETRAYPLRILVWHEVVNDRIGGKTLAITYCPLCGTAMVFCRDINGLTLSFGVSGLLYQSDVLLYDRQTESLWSQLAMRAVTGDLSNTGLQLQPSEMMNWKGWKQKHPQGRVLSSRTGVPRDYWSDPYADYEKRPTINFPVPQHRAELPNKAWVIGAMVGRDIAAYPLETLTKQGRIVDRIGNLWVEILFDRESNHASVRAMDSGQRIPYVKSYWFAWQAFYPETRLWRP